MHASFQSRSPFMPDKADCDDMIIGFEFSRVFLVWVYYDLQLLEKIYERLFRLLVEELPISYNNIPCLETIWGKLCFEIEH